MTIPRFDDRGLLPAGTHRAGRAEVDQRFGATAWRKDLLEGFWRVVAALRKAGCRRVYLDGSFVTNKVRPGDFDGCWETEGVDPDRLDPVLLDFTRRREAQIEKYGGEMFPADFDADGLGTTFLEFFQTDKETRRRKGIVMIELEDAR